MTEAGLFLDQQQQLAAYKKPITEAYSVDFSHVVGGRSFRVASETPFISDPDFSQIADIITSTKGMTPVADEDLEKSWRSGLAVSVFDGNKAIGYSRLKDKGVVFSRTEEEKNLLGSGESKRRVYEIASVFLGSELQGTGLGHTLLKSSMRLRIKEVLEGKAVFITTTELPNFAFLSSLSKASSSLGIKFLPMVHTSISEIANAACGNCAGLNCAKRVLPIGIANFVNKGESPQEPNNCVLFYSRVVSN